MEEYRNDLEIRIFGMRRCGNHAIVNWIAAQSPSLVHFFNNVSKNGWSPFLTKTGRGTRKGTKLENIWYRHGKYKEEKPEKLKKVVEMKKEVLMYSFEDLDITELLLKELPFNREKVVGKSKKKIDILIIRNIFNLFASRLKFQERGNIIDIGKERKIFKYFKKYENWGKDAKEIDARDYKRVDKLMKVFLSHVKEATGETNILENKIIILFDKWFIDKEYRKNIINKIGFEFTDRGKDLLAAVHNKGSIFDNFKYEHNPEEMDILNRWKYFENNKIFKSIFKCFLEQVGYNSRVFGEDKETIEWIGKD